MVDIEKARRNGILSSTDKPIEVPPYGPMSKALQSAPDEMVTLTRTIPSGLIDPGENTKDVTVQFRRPPGVLVAEIREKDIASIQILDKKGTKILPSYTKFYVEGVQRGSQEKVQVVETFEDPNYYFYGSRPKIYQLSGVMRNDQANNWSKQFDFIWQTLLKGTRLAEMKAKAYLSVDEVMWVGYPTVQGQSVTALQDNSLRFSMSFLVFRVITRGPFDADIVAKAAMYTKDVEGIGSSKSRISEMTAKRKVSSDELYYFEFPTI